MTATIIKISPISAHTTEADIYAEIPAEWIDSVAIDHASNIAYIKLKESQLLEALAGKFGDDLHFSGLNAKGQIVEDESFNWQATVDALKSKAQQVHAQAAEAVETGKEKLSQVASDVQDKAETLASQVNSKVEDVKEQIADTASKISDKVADQVETIQSATKDAVETGKEKLNEAVNVTKSTISGAVDAAKEKASEVKENISQGLDKAKDSLSDAKDKVTEKLGSTVEAGKAKLDEGVQGCAKVLRNIEVNSIPIEPLAPKHRSKLIEFVLLVWLFSLMI